MQAAVSSKQSASAEKSPRIDIPGLEGKVTEITLPDTVTEQLVVMSKRKGETKNQKTTDIPFSAAFEVNQDSPKEVLGAFGFEQSPAKNFSLHLSLGTDAKKKSLQISGSLPYTVTKHRTETYTYRSNYVSRGQHTPYGPKDSPGYWQYGSRTQQVPYDVAMTERREKKAANEREFNHLYLSLLNSGPSEKRTALLDFLHQNFQSESEKAQSWISGTIREKVREERAAAEKRTAELEGIRLPKIKRG